MKTLFRSIHVVLVGVLVLSTTLVVPINLAGARPILQEIAPIDQPIIDAETPIVELPIVGEFTPLPEPAPAVGIMMSPIIQPSGVGSITLSSVTPLSGNQYVAIGAWTPTANCWAPGAGYQFMIDIVDHTNGDAILTTINPAPCDGHYNDDVPEASRKVGGVWPANGQGGNTFVLGSGGHEVCAVLRHANGVGGDVDWSNCQSVNLSCANPLDYVNDNGAFTPDGKIGLSDSVIFTNYYLTDDSKANVNGDRKVDNKDLECADKYYSTGLYECPISCPVCGDGNVDKGEECDDGNDVNNDACKDNCKLSNAPKSDTCRSPLDYEYTDGTNGPDGKIDLSDATAFTDFYKRGQIEADVNHDQVVNAKDYLCAKPYYSGQNNNYDCQLDCANLCVNPLDYNVNYVIGLDDGTEFTQKYNAKDSSADINNNGMVDEGDLACAESYIAGGNYECTINCAPMCGDGNLSKRLGEQCDDGNTKDGDGCTSTCELENVQSCDVREADYDNDGEITLSDAVKFTEYYKGTPVNDEADLNHDSNKNNGDYLCMKIYLNSSAHVPALEEVSGFGGSSSANNVSTPNYDLNIISGNIDSVNGQVLSLAPVVPQPVKEQPVTKPTPELVKPTDDTKVVVKQGKTVVRIESAVKPIEKPVAVVTSAPVQTQKPISTLGKIILKIVSVLGF